MGKMPKASPVVNYAPKESGIRKNRVLYAVLALVVISVAIGAISFYKTNQLTAAVTGKTVSIEDFLKKLTSHSEMKAYVGISPLNIIQITTANLGNLQSQINGLDTSYIGDYIVQYNDRIAIYNFEKDTIKATVGFQQPAQLPQDFFAKLNKHPELSGLESQQPIGGQLDAESLSKLKEQFPDVYKDVKVNDFLLRYQTLLVVYDYSNDKIVVLVKLG